MAGNNKAALQGDVELGKNIILGSILNEEGISQLFQLAQQAGPDLPAAIAHALALSFQGARQAIESNQLPIDSRAWASDGGVIDGVIEEVQAILASKMGDSMMDPGLHDAIKQGLFQLLQQDQQGSQEPPQGQPGAVPMQGSGMPPEVGPQPDQGLLAPPQGMMG